jgi:Fur family peroxide stress response transcriptional regulator
MEPTNGSGLKLTPQRLAIFDYLKDNTDHPSAEDVYAAVAKKFPTMSFATVYNTLETLRRRGELLELTIDPRRKRFDPNPRPHHHLICVQCKRIVDIHATFELTVPGRDRADFELLGNHVEFYGICGNCTQGDGATGDGKGKTQRRSGKNGGRSGRG